MLKSKLVEILQEEIKQYGDCHIRKVEVHELGVQWSRQMYSPKRKNSMGERANMNLKEFEEYCKNNPITTKEGKDE